MISFDRFCSNLAKTPMIIIGVLAFSLLDINLFFCFNIVITL